MNKNFSTNPTAVSSRTLLALIFAAGLTGCASFAPQALQPAEVLTTAQADKAAQAKDVVPLSGPLSLEEAVARAIKFNAERRLKAMEEAVAYGTFEAGKFDMLPKLVASAGYRYRDKDLLTSSRDLETGALIGARTISSSAEATTADLGLSWSLLDFGQSYYAAKQNGDRMLIAAERRRKAIHTLVQDVRTAYWRVVAADKLSANVRATIQEAEGALQDARKAEGEMLRSPLEPLRFQRQLLENLRLLEVVEQELSSARIELASLIGLPQTQAITVVEPAGEIQTAWLDAPVDAMETQALAFNPDLRESMYNARIAQEETRRAMLKFFPGLSFNYGIKRSDDAYLVNQSWNEAGVQLSYNLLGLLGLPAQMRLAEAGVALADQKRVATQMAVLTQLHIARLQYANATRQFARADAIAAVDGRIVSHVSNQEQAQKQTKLERVSQQTASILSSLRRYQAMSNVQAAASRLQATLGMELSVEGSDTMPLADLTAAVSRSLQSWEAGKLQPQPQAAAARD